MVEVVFPFLVLDSDSGSDRKMDSTDDCHIHYPYSFLGIYFYPSAIPLAHVHYHYSYSHFHSHFPIQILIQNPYHVIVDIYSEVVGTVPQIHLVDLPGGF